MERDTIIETLRGLRGAFEREGVSHVALFGSRARGDARQDSDIDLLIDVQAGKRFSVTNLVGVEHIVSDTLGVRANAFMRRSLDHDFRRSIAEDVIEVF